MNTLIFSKDRPCQLELLLRSITEMFVDYESNGFYILYKYTDDISKEGYNKLKEQYNFNFINEISFKKDTVEIINNFEDDLTMFLVDDDVFKEKLNLSSEPVTKFLENNNICCLSLRLSPNLRRCYTIDSAMLSPHFESKWIWNWNNSQYDFAYPMSLDGHIFRTKEIVPLIQNLNFINPNQLESKLHMNKINKPLMSCFETSRIVNIPDNRVQNEFKNRHANGSLKNLNSKFLEGFRISTDNIYGIDNISCHQEIKYKLENENTNTDTML
jgi:hypothetical protein